jgi:hypothetical protein
MHSARQSAAATAPQPGGATIAMAGNEHERSWSGEFSPVQDEYINVHGPSPHEPHATAPAIMFKVMSVAAGPRAPAAQ